MNSDKWDDDLIDLYLGCQNIFDELDLDSIDVAAMLNSDFYEPKSRNTIKTTAPP